MSADYVKNISVKQTNQQAIFLAKFTIIYNLFEGVIAILFGVQHESVALWGFGFDSFIEAFSAAAIWLRFADKISDQNAQKFIAILFFLLGAATVYGSGHALLTHQSPDTTIPGTIVAVVSIGVMLWLWRAKVILAKQTGSQSLLADANCAKACMQLSVVLLIGSLLHVLVPTLWWVDSVAALVISGFIFREGWEQWSGAAHNHGEGHCC